MNLKIKHPIVVFLSILTVFVIYIGVVLYNIWPIDNKTLAQAGAFGDSFGVLTSVFSALAFGGLIITIWQQQEELQQNRNEIRVQHFENILFRMLEVHTEIVRGLDIQRKNVKTGQADTISVGRDCFTNWEITLRKRYMLELKSSGGVVALEKSYNYFWKTWNKDLGHYFRFLYNMIKHIDTSEVKSKKEYSNIIRAQLSDYELVFLFYNCLHSNGVDKFKPLCEKYALFDNLPIDLLLDPSHKDLYNKKAFNE